MHPVRAQGEVSGFAAGLLPVAEPGHSTGPAALVHFNLSDTERQASLPSSHGKIGWEGSY